MLASLSPHEMGAKICLDLLLVLLVRVNCVIIFHRPSPLLAAINLKEIPVAGLAYVILLGRHDTARSLSSMWSVVTSQVALITGQRESRSL